MTTSIPKATLHTLTIILHSLTITLHNLATSFLIAATSLYCIAVADILLPDNGNAPQILETFPKDGEIGAGTDIEPSILFDRPMDWEKSQSAFRLSSSGSGVAGILEGLFLWQEDRLIFQPRLSLKKNALYYMSLDKSAESREGINLEEELLIYFQAGSDLEGPQLIASDPANNAADVAPGHLIRLNFSEEIDLVTLNEGLSLQPNFIFTTEQSSDKREIALIPASPLTTGSYNLSLNTQITDLAGNPLQQEKGIRFTVGSDFESPKIEMASIGAVLLQQGQTVTGVERKEALQLLFSEEMSRPESESALLIRPFAAFKKQWEEEGRQLNLNFLNLAPETSYTLSIDTSARDIQKNPLDNSYSFSFYTDGGHSQRPQVLQVEQIYVDNAGGIDGAVAMDSGAVLSQLDHLDTTQLIDEDPSSGTDFVLYLKLLFNRAMLYTHLLSGLSFEKIIDLTSTRIAIHSMELSADGKELILKLQGNPFDVTGRRDIPIWKLKIDRQVEDENNNSLERDYELFLSY